MEAPAIGTGEFTLIDYASIFRRRWLWVLLPPAFLIGLATLYTANQQPSYQATARVLLADSAAQRTLDPSSQNTGFLTRELSNEISLAKSDRVEDLVVEARGELSNITISAESTADVLVFRSTAATDVGAAEDANLWAEMYIQVKREDAVANITAATSSLQSRLEQLRLERQALRAPLDDLDRRISVEDDPEVADQLQREYDRLADDLSYELQLVTGQAESTLASLNELELQAELSDVGEVRIVQVAAPPEDPSNPSLRLNLSLAAVAGLMLGVLLALFLDSRDRTINSASDVQAVTDLPVLAVIPKTERRRKTKPELATSADPDGVFADGFHKLRSALEFISFDHNVSSIMITSAAASEGKSTTAANLSLAFASIGKRTLLVDVDFRRGRVHKIFGFEKAPGISDFVLNDAAAKTISRPVSSGDGHLLAIPTGSTPPNPASFVGTPKFLSTLDWLAGEADVAVFDAPPLLAVSEAHTLGKHVDLVVLTAMAGKTTSDELADVVAELRQVGADVAGVVLIGVSDADSYARYRDYYRSSSSETAEHQAINFDSDQQIDLSRLSPTRTQGMPGAATSGTPRRGQGESPQAQPIRKQALTGSTRPAQKATVPIADGRLQEQPIAGRDLRLLGSEASRPGDQNLPPRPSGFDQNGAWRDVADRDHASRPPTDPLTQPRADPLPIEWRD